MIIDDYIEIQNNYRNRFGKRTLLLFQNGSFFECFSIEAPGPENSVSILGNLCNIIITRKNKAKSEINRENHMLAGFPLASLQRYLSVLLKENYTIVLVEQTSSPPNPKREVTGVYSPGTNMDMQLTTSNANSNNFLMCLFFMKTKDVRFAKEWITMSMAALDVSTGESYVYEMLKIFDKSFAFEESLRLLKFFKPSEVIIMLEKVPDDEDLEIKNLLKTLDLHEDICHIQIQDSCERKIAFCEEFLQRIYIKNQGLLSCIESLGLEQQPQAVSALVKLLRFASDHNSAVINGLEVPQIISSVKKLCLEHTAAVQLGVADNSTGNILTLLSPLTMTNMGKRHLRYRLLLPDIDIKTINRNLDLLQSLLPIWSEVNEHLKQIQDIERLQRKAKLGKLMPGEIDGLLQSYECIQKLFDLMRDKHINLSINEKLNVQFKTFISSVTDQLNISNCSLYNQYAGVESNLFAANKFPDIDKLQQNLDNTAQIFIDASIYLTSLLTGKSSIDIAKSQDSLLLVKFDKNDKDGWQLICTKKRAEALLIKLKQMTSKEILNFPKIGGISLNPNEFFIQGGGVASNAKFMHPVLVLKSSENKTYQTAMRERCKDEFIKFQINIMKQYDSVLNQITQTIAYIDVANCGARSADLYKYCRPVLVDSEDSFIEIGQVRHPVIERRENLKEKYVANDISLGIADSYQGLFVYSPNAAGKSSLSKSIGLCAVMAQAGFYVSASSCKLAPFHKIMTRIVTTDNISKGHSSFATEIGEIRSILSRADQNSLVLGDEPCSTTESTSGLSIVASVTAELIGLKSKFVFATHLHALPDLNVIKKLGAKISHKHLQVDFDTANQKLIYVRKLQDGPGSSQYGIEVAKALGLPDHVIKTAQEIRKEFVQQTGSYEENQIVDTSNKSTRYNKNVYFKLCEVCGKNGEDCHHITFQNQANEKGRIDTRHKNHMSNLVILCKKCHVQVHSPPKGSKKLLIFGYKQTSSGIELDFKFE